MNERHAKWHCMTAEAVLSQLHTDAACGLSRKAARSRLRKQGRNPLFDGTMPKTKDHIKKLLLDPALLLMLFGALLAIVFLSPLQIVCAVLSLGLLIATLWRFLYRLDALSRITEQYRTPTVHVLRD